ncbi:hypothetical protein LTR56_020551 [Elasticomyces elasticus]|nr:hypothetical protein LTR56_020551 [Elasticomyces elasticus]KAK3655841.1 hypothetical protein LTR22_010136 [Elasticomyces elasticus]KAK4925820.1 hypothetical protein LTR49_007196 [Elasticomyces elasticus]KAK5764773.1 hypothetical protein LTS12_005042 [Elasticomyces elasticus]
MASPTSSALLSIPNELKLHVLSHLNFQDLDSVSIAYEEFQALIAVHRRPLMREIHKNSYDRLRSTIDRLGFADKDLCTAFLEFTNRVPAQKLRGYHKDRGVGMFAGWYCADNRHIFETDRLWSKSYYQVFDFGCEVLQIKAVEEESSTRDTDGCMRLESIMESMRSLGFHLVSLVHPAHIIDLLATLHIHHYILSTTIAFVENDTRRTKTAGCVRNSISISLLGYPLSLQRTSISSITLWKRELTRFGKELELEEIAEIMGSIKVESFTCCQRWGLRRLK